jgi:hypothetical protein
VGLIGSVQKKLDGFGGLFPLEKPARYIQCQRFIAWVCESGLEKVVERLGWFLIHLVNDPRRESSQTLDPLFARGVGQQITVIRLD